MRTNPWLLAGVFAPLVYAGAVALGGWLTPGYSHLADPVSVLIVDNAPAAAALDPIFTVYNALMIVFAVALGRAFAGVGVALRIIVPGFLAITGLAGILMDFYPMDPIGAVITYSGSVHIWLAAIASVATMLAVLVFGLSLRRNPDWRRFAGYSLVSFIVIFFSGVFAALAATRASPVMGLWERVTIGAFLLWMFVLALVLLAGRGVAAPR